MGGEVYDLDATTIKKKAYNIYLYTCHGHFAPSYWHESAGHS